MKSRTKTRNLQKKLLVVALCAISHISMFAQNQKVTVNLQNVPLGTAMQAIGKQANVKIAYSKEFVDTDKKVSIKSTNEKLDNVLKRLFKNLDVAYSYGDKSILLYKKSVNEKNADASTDEKSDNLVDVSGTVVDSNNEPIIGATVSLVGTNTGVVTDIDGNFQLKAPKGSRIRISYIGSSEKVLNIKKAEHFDVVMQENSTDLEEVVVVGYGTQKKVNVTAGIQFNISSPRQVGEVLFDRLKIGEKARKTKSGQYATTEEVLERLRPAHPIVGKILDLRGLRKLLSTYINALPELINPATGKIHTSYNQTVTATGRLSSSNPNLQNIPIRDAEGKGIRRAFVPEKGCKFLSADYSQIELRIMAHISQDRHMIEAFCSGADIHTATAAKIYKVPISEVTADMRRKAKTANFGIIYGISAFGLAERLNISRAEAKQLIEDYFASFPQIKEHMAQSIEVARKQGFVTTLCGRRRMLPDINSHNSVVRGYAEPNSFLADSVAIASTG